MGASSVLRECSTADGVRYRANGELADRLGIATQPIRYPLPLTEDDLENADLTIAVKETEHRPLMQTHFSTWEHKIEYWKIHDLDFATADEALPVLRMHVQCHSCHPTYS